MSEQETITLTGKAAVEVLNLQEEDNDYINQYQFDIVEVILFVLENVTHGNASGNLGKREVDMLCNLWKIHNHYETLKKQ